MKMPKITSVAVDSYGGHDHVRVFVDGMLSGELIVDEGDGAWLATRLRATDADFDERARLAAELERVRAAAALDQPTLSTWRAMATNWLGADELTLAAGGTELGCQMLALIDTVEAVLGIDNSARQLELNDAFQVPFAARVAAASYANRLRQAEATGEPRPMSVMEMLELEGEDD
jgi:hypothetical protein